MNKDLFIDYYGDGRDPTKIRQHDYIENGFRPLALIDVIRERCKTCKDDDDKIKKCSDLKCPSWPYRFGKSPFKETQTDWPKKISFTKIFWIDVNEDETFQLKEATD